MGFVTYGDLPELNEGCRVMAHESPYALAVTRSSSRVGGRMGGCYRAASPSIAAGLSLLVGYIVKFVSLARPARVHPRLVERPTRLGYTFVLKGRLT
jgi:hypothetical protein